MTQTNEMKVTRDALRLMKVGETRVFDLPSRAAIESAKATAYQAGNVLGRKFATSGDYDNLKIIITRTE